MENNIFFQPFVGKHYADGGMFGKRIMILGESTIVTRDAPTVATAVCIASAWALRRMCSLIISTRRTNGRTGCVRS